MVRLVTTTPIVSALEAIPPSLREDLKLPESLQLGNPISHDEVIRISRHFHEATHSPENADRSLDSLLRGTKLYIPPPPPKPEPSPEYLAQKARLLAAVESDAYKRMLSAPSPSNPRNPSSPALFASSTSKVAALHQPDPSLEDPNYTDPLTPSLVLNIFLSVLITGFSVYWALTSFQTPEILVETISSTWSYSSPASGSGSSSSRGRSGGAGASEPVRVLVSLFAALGVGVAEVVIYAIYLGKIEQARDKEGRVKEKKEIIGGDEVGGNTKRDRNRDQHLPVGTGEMTTAEENEKEVIWGRGPNGGLRRRVREKWEEETTKDQE
ncbi:endoplasmic reticulum-based factor for assembly of V-ATPase-domain-containing protein [Aspergillus varians]